MLDGLRVLEGDQDKRYALPATCVGAHMYNGNIYAVAKDYIYRADTGSQRFFGYKIPGDAGEITASYGITSDGKMLLASGDTMYALTLPN